MTAAKKELSERELLQQIIERLDRLTTVATLAGFQSLHREENNKVLSNLGYADSQMAEMHATPKGTVDRTRASQGKEPPGK